MMSYLERRQADKAKTQARRVRCEERATKMLNLASAERILSLMASSPVTQEMLATRAAILRQSRRN